MDALCAFRSMLDKNKGYLAAITFCLILVSPLIPTGLGLKQYTRLNEIFIIAAAGMIFIINLISGRVFKFKKIELLLLVLGLWMSVSILHGYIFLGVTPSPRDFYQIFNIILFGIYFRLGTFFNHKDVNRAGVLRLFFISILGLNFISIIQLSQWGVKNILPLYVPARGGHLERYILYCAYTGGLSRTLGIITSPTSFSIIMVVIITLLAAWIIYNPTKSKRFGLSVTLLFTASVISMILTFSRSGFIALIISQLFLFCMVKFKERIHISKIILYYFLVLILSLTFVFNINKFLNTSFSNLRGFRVSFMFSKGEMKPGLSDSSQGLSSANEAIQFSKYETFLPENIPYAISDATSQGSSSEKAAIQLSKYKTHLPPGQTSYGVSDVTNRVLLWKNGIQKGMLSPIFGWGPAHASNIKAEETGLSSKEGKYFYGPHNEYIDIFIQTGLIGLILFLALFISVFRKANQILKENTGYFVLFLARSVQTIIIAFAIFDLADGFWFNAIIPAMLMMLFGAMYGTDRQQKQEPV